MNTRWLIERAGVQVTVSANGEAAKSLVRVAINGMRAERVSKAHGIKLSVSGKSEDWGLRDHSNNVRRKITNAGDLIYHLTDRIVFHIADNMAARHCLHAAAVCHQGQALIIPANSGAGKSSFTSWLVAKGFDYITDELILIDDNKSLDGIARPIQIKPNGIDAIAHLIKESSETEVHPEQEAGYFPGKLANAVPVSSLGGRISEDSETQLGLMIFPKYQKGTEFEFNQLSSAEAGMRLMANHVNARNLEGHGFKAMMEVIRNTPCYSLDYGGFAALPYDFAGQLKDLLTQVQA